MYLQFYISKALDQSLFHECPNAIKVGLSYFDPINKIEDINSKDIKLDYCITPNKVYKFSE